MTKQKFSKRNIAKRLASASLNRHLGASKDFFNSFRDDLAVAADAARARRETPYSVHPDETEAKWNKKKAFFLIEIQLYQLGFLGVLAYSAITLSFTVYSLFFTLWCAGWYSAKIRETYRARYVSANWAQRRRPLPLSWADFYKQAKNQPLILVPTWRIFK